jgi:ATP-dependent helicase/nuclease subunit A
VSGDPLREAQSNQARAADPTYSVFVTANAGSGKTKVLIDRLARLLLRGVRPSAFLCITYTKAAAAEMQRRLFERLGGWCVADDATLAQELEALGAARHELSKARALFARALETPGGLKIQTIHAFCERLLARFPIEARVPPGFDIADEARAGALLGRARAQAALAADAPREAFQRFAARMHGDGVDALLDRLALKRGDFHRFALGAQGELFAAQRLRDRHDVTQSNEDFLHGFAARWQIEDMRRAAAALATGGVSDQSAAEKLRKAAAATTPRAVLDACFDFAFTSEGKRRARLATQKVLAAHGWLEGFLSDLAAACWEARERLNAIERAEDAVAALALALKLDQAYADAKARAGVLDFDDLIEHTRLLLQRSEAAPWVLYKLDGGLDHILIDEGQDTSPAQWDLIEPLQQEFFAGRGARERVRTVFAVGDPKQSIYAFQGADPERFLSEAQRLSSRAAAARSGFAKPELRTSFRTSPEVLRVVDAVCARRPLLQDPQGADVIEHLAARGGESGAVEVWPVAMRPMRIEAQAWDAPLDVEREASVHVVLARALAERVATMRAAGEAVWDKGALRTIEAKDVLVLVRTRGALFREMIKAFKRAGFPVAGADRMVLRDELAVEDCLALMRFALDPADDLALACVLKGPWCGLEDDDVHLFPLAYGRDRGETLLSRLMAGTEAAFADARAFVSNVLARGSSGAFSFLSWALETRHGGGASGWERVLTRLGREARDPLEELLQRALKPASHNAATLQRFLYEIEVDSGQVKRELEADTGAVRVMTVHGAKGLEAPIVILPDATGAVSDAPEDGLMFDAELGPFVSFRGKDDDEATARVREQYEARVMREHWRLLYVAMTRARDRLIVCGVQHGNAKTGEADESWRLVVEEALEGLGAAPCETPFGGGKRLGAPQIVKSASLVATARNASKPDWLYEIVTGAKLSRPLAPSLAGGGRRAGFSPRRDGGRRFRRGLLIHGLLQRLPDVAPERRENAADAWLKRQGVTAQDREALAREALAVIDERQFAKVFGPGSRAEAPIVGAVGSRRVRGFVDRLLVEEARVLIVDFKTDRPAPLDVADTPQDYVAQLALYRAVMAQIFPDRDVDCALVWTEAPRLVALPAPLLDAALHRVLSGENGG